MARRQRGPFLADAAGPQVMLLFANGLENGRGRQKRDLVLATATAEENADTELVHRNYSNGAVSTQQSAVSRPRSSGGDVQVSSTAGPHTRRENQEHVGLTSSLIAAGLAVLAGLLHEISQLALALFLSQLFHGSRNHRVGAEDPLVSLERAFHPGGVLGDGVVFFVWMFDEEYHVTEEHLIQKVGSVAIA